MRRCLLLACFFWIYSCSQAQQIVQLEYYFDTDPGWGNGIQIPITPDTAITNLLFTADVSTLTQGLHSLNIRSKNASGNWSLTATQSIYKFPLITSSNSPIIKLEYFVDNDPGFGNATPVSITADTALQNIMFQINSSSLNSGIHVLYVRCADATGKWSTTRAQHFYKFPEASNNPTQSLTAIEYFIDSDPGFGNGIAIPFTSDTLVSALNFSPNVTSLASGLHILYLRSKNANHSWSLTQSQYFYKFPPTPNNGVAQAINQIEYFIDSDPGFGNGIALPFTSDTLVSTLNFSPNVTSLASGLHVLYLRSKNANQSWSLTQSQYFYKFPPTPNNGIAQAINQIEYFIDSDPGFGNAQPLTITSDSIITLLNFNAAVSVLNSGLHELYIRAKDNYGVWSLTTLQYFYKFPTINNDPLITKMEYFVDNDPGFGNAIQVPVSPNTALNALALSVDASNLALGIHHVFVRSYDATGAWSLSKAGRFTRDKIKFFLQGYYAGANQMYPVLMNEGIGNATNIVDTVTIELRQSSSPYTLKASATGLLQTNGEVICNLPNVQGNYYIVIKHRSGIETWSATAITLGNNTLTYDFSTAANKAYGNNQKQMQPGVFAFYSGDINQDKSIDAFDYLLLNPDIEEGLFGYYNTDLNGDGVVDLFDFLLLDSNIIQGISTNDPL
ncbi:MAG: dockerin type I repeat-containing protein [Chitinophagaceae bacterium]|nr:dockerin type I repeat-containing protein [Chitinophagaceae bacterium]